MTVIVVVCVIVFCVIVIWYHSMSCEDLIGDALQKGPNDNDDVTNYKWHSVASAYRKKMSYLHKTKQSIYNLKLFP